MAALTRLQTPGLAHPSPAPSWRGASWLAALYFLVPLAASVVFTVDVPGQGFTLDSYTQIFCADGFGRSLLLSLELAAATIARRAAAAGARHGRGAARRAPAAAGGRGGLLAAAGGARRSRWSRASARCCSGDPTTSPHPAVPDLRRHPEPGLPRGPGARLRLMALPLVYRALDAGLRAVDVRTLVEAARSCGAGWPQALVRVVLPNLRGALLNTSFLTLALVLGEYTVASILGFQPFAVWIVSVGGSAGPDVRRRVGAQPGLLTWAAAAPRSPRCRRARRRRCAPAGETMTAPPPL